MNKLNKLLLIPVLFAGFFLRVHELGRESLWLDEGYMWVVVVNTSLRDVVMAMLPLNSTTPLGYVIIWLTVPLFGLTEFSLRMSSALIGLLVVPVVYRLGREMFSGRVGVLAGACIALMPFLVWFARDAKPYAAYLLFSALAMWGFWRFAQGRGKALLIIASMAWYLSHYLSALFAYAQAMFIFTRIRRAPLLLRQWVVMQAIAVVPVAGWGLLFFTQTHRKLLNRVPWIPSVSVFTPLQTLWNYITGDAVEWNGLMVIGVLALVGLIVWGARRLTIPAQLLLWWLCLPLITGWLFSFYVPSYVDRYFTPIAVPLVLLLSAGLLELPPRVRYGAVAVVLIVMLTSTLRFFGDARFAKEDWRGAAEFATVHHLPIGVIDPESHTGLMPYLSSQTQVVLARDGQELSQRFSEGDMALLIRSPRESAHALSKSAPFDPLAEGPEFFRQWLAENPSAVVDIHPFTGLALVVIGK